MFHIILTDGVFLVFGVDPSLLAFVFPFALWKLPAGSQYKRSWFAFFAHSYQKAHYSSLQNDAFIAGRRSSWRTYWFQSLFMAACLVRIVWRAEIQQYTGCLAHRHKMGVGSTGRELDKFLLFFSHLSGFSPKLGMKTGSMPGHSAHLQANQPVCKYSLKQ